MKLATRSGVQGFANISMFVWEASGAATALGDSTAGPRSTTVNMRVFACDEGGEIYRADSSDGAPTNDVRFWAGTRVRWATASSGEAPSAMP